MPARLKCNSIQEDFFDTRKSQADPCECEKDLCILIMKPSIQWPRPRNSHYSTLFGMKILGGDLKKRKKKEKKSPIKHIQQLL